MYQPDLSVENFVLMVFLPRTHAVACAGCLGLCGPTLDRPDHNKCPWGERGFATARHAPCARERYGVQNNSNPHRSVKDRASGSDSSSSAQSPFSKPSSSPFSWFLKKPKQEQAPAPQRSKSVQESQAAQQPKTSQQPATPTTSQQLSSASVSTSQQGGTQANASQEARASSQVNASSHPTPPQAGQPSASQSSSPQSSSNRPPQVSSLPGVYVSPQSRMSSQPGAAPQSGDFNSIPAHWPQAFSVDIAAAEARKLGQGKAVIAGALGIFSIIFAIPMPLMGFILGLIAIVLAVKSRKEIGRDIKTTVGKVCGIISVVIAVIQFVVYAAIFAVGLSSLYATYDGDFETIIGVITGEIPYQTEEELAAQEENKAEVVEVVSAQFDLLINQDEELVAELTEQIEDSFDAYMGVTHEALGVDPADLVRWMLTDLTYEVGSVYVYDYGDGYDVTADAYIDVEYRDFYDFFVIFYESIENLNETYRSQGGMTTEEYAGRVSDLYYEAMEETTTTTSYFTYLSLTEVDGEWVVDEESWQSALDYMFLFYF